SGETDTPIMLMPILRTSVHFAPESAEISAMRDAVDHDWVEFVHQHLIENADGRLFRDAIKVGTDMLKRTDPAASFYGDVLHILGTLHLDPYSLRPLDNYDGAIFRWRRRFLEANHQELG